MRGEGEEGFGVDFAWCLELLGNLRRCFFGVSTMDLWKTQCDGDGSGGNGGARVSSMKRERKRVSFCKREKFGKKLSLAIWRPF